jgi:hypothetical protein
MVEGDLKLDNDRDWDFDQMPIPSVMCAVFFVPKLFWANCASRRNIDMVQWYEYTPITHEVAGSNPAHYKYSCA